MLKGRIIKYKDRIKLMTKEIREYMRFKTDIKNVIVKVA